VVVSVPSSSPESEIYELSLKYALKNAIDHGGKAQLEAVVKKVIGERPELRGRIKEIIGIMKKAVEDVNKMSVNEQRKLAEEKWPEILVKEVKEEKKELPPLPGAKEGAVVTRFAPNPDFVLHLGNARPAVLSYVYAKRYKGRFILRFEDTDPKKKTPILEAYDLIKEDLRWLGIEWDEEYIQSLRMEIYYGYARKLLEMGKAYVCTHSPKEVSEMRRKGMKDPCSDNPIEEHLEKWDKMLSGEFGEGEAILRIKTDYRHKDPSVRDWIAFRIIDTDKHPHPLVGSKYVVWPTYNFACAIDDHLMGITHILRAKEHQTNTVKQSFIYKYFGWEQPEAIHFGRLNLEGTVLSKSKMREGIKEKLYRGWDDPRLGTLIALRRRGILPEAIRDLMLDVGIKPSSARISIDNLHAYNRKYLEPIANRYMFVYEPTKVELVSEKPLKAKIPYHPSFPERGHRELVLKMDSRSSFIYLCADDVEKFSVGYEFRLLGMANFRVESLNPPVAVYVGSDASYAVSKKLPILQWVPEHDNVPVTVLRVVKGDLIEEEGLAEPAVRNLEKGSRVQFFRYGFAILDSWRDGSPYFYYTHN